MDIPTPKRRQHEREPRRMRKGMYILPSLFTTGNMAAGFYAILEVVHASALTISSMDTAGHLDNAAKAIGFAVLFDGLDGRVARMTGTSSDFGKEFDSLADVITFGVAPAMLAWTWGFHLIAPVALPEWNIKLTQLGAIAAFLFLMAGASRLARFNITTNPQPSNPGRPGKKYFVGMPIPAGAGVIAAVVHFQGGAPLDSWYTAITWLAMVAAVGYLMVSTWRFYSFKDIDFSSRRPFRLIILLGALLAGLWFFSKPVLFGVALLYTFSGVFWRLQWIFRRRRQQPPPPSYKEASQTS
jgi:CDP-diacylglycerol---serine O-phosphatidyltransferase